MPPTLALFARGKPLELGGSADGRFPTLCRPWPAAGSEQWNFNIQVMSTALGDASFNELIRVSGLTKQGRVWEKTDSARIDGQLKIRPHHRGQWRLYRALRQDRSAHHEHCGYNGREIGVSPKMLP